MDKPKRWILVAVVFGSAIVFLDSTVVNVALPKIAIDLPSRFFGKLEGPTFVYGGYLLTLSALLILAGALSDFFGRRKMFLIGLTGFGATSLLCGLAPNMELLIAFRLLQGAAGAFLVPGSLAIITAGFKGEEQGRAFGIWAGGSAAATILGPFVGGLLVETISWRTAFLINIPLVIIAYYATAKYVEESRDEEASGKFDWSGAVVVAVAIGGLAFGAIRGQQSQWHDVGAFVALGLGLAATVLFPFLMARSANPLVPLELFKSRNFTVTNISTLVIYGALYGSFYYLPAFTEGTLGYNATAAGLSSLPSGIFLVVLSSRFGKLSARYGPRWFMAAGPAIMAAGLLWFARIPSTSTIWIIDIVKPSTLVPPGAYLVDILPGLIIFGIGLAIMVAPLTTALMTSVAPQKSGVASAINNAISRVGPQLAGALIFVAITASFYGGLAKHDLGVNTSSTKFRIAVAPLIKPPSGLGPDLKIAVRESSTRSFHLSMTIAAGLLLIGAAVNAVGIRNSDAMPPTETAGPNDDEPAAAAAAA
ncbi:MAG: MFS transporter [Actinomycetota bacterium]